jgi:hypothetical protein
MKKTTFAIQNTKTLELLTLNAETGYYTDFDGDSSVQITTEYSIDSHGDLGVWETPDLWAALLVKEFRQSGDWASKDTPDCSLSSTRIVAVHRLNDTVKVISDDDVPQSIFDLIDGMEEFLKLDSYNSEFVFCELTYTSKKIAYENNPKDTKINGYNMSRVYSVLEHLERLPEVYADDHLFIVAMNDLLRTLY